MLIASDAHEVVPENNFVSNTVTHSANGNEAVLSARRTRCDFASNELALQYGGIDAQVARMYLRASSACEIIQSGRRIALPPRLAMQTSFRDVEEPCAWPIAHALDVVSFELPRTAVKRWADESSYRNFTGIKIRSGMSTSDDTIKSLGFSLLRTLEAPDRYPQLVIDGLLDSLCGYLVGRYGDGESGTQNGGLAPWQERRAKEVIDAHLTTNISLQAIAHQCDLSVAHFSRAFRKSTGLTPYKWLIHRRIERAISLLEVHDLSLAQVASRSGFADQSHFNHVFASWVGISPGAYRKSSQKTSKS